MAYHSKLLQFLSLLQILVGSISLILGIGSVVLLSDFTSLFGFGIWVGVWIIVTGMLGFFGSRDRQAPNKCLLYFFMGFAITACVFAGGMIICYSIALSELATARLRCYNYGRRYWSPVIPYSGSGNGKGCNLSKVEASIFIDAVLLIIGVVEFSVAIASSAVFCCYAVCPGNSPVQGQGMQVVYIQPTIGQTPTNAGGGEAVLTAGAPGTVMQAPTGQFFVQQPGQPATFVPVSQPQAIPSSMVNQPQQTAIPGGTATVQTHQAQYKNSDAPPAYT